MLDNTLSSLLSVMPAIQARQINELLQSLQVAGQVRDAQEYSDKLTELSTLVNDSVPVPSFTQIRSLAWYLSSSNAHNIMMQSAKNDIEAAFLQIEEIGNKLDDHYSLFIENLLKDLENGLNKQEDKIKKLEWLNNKDNEFTNVLVDSFSATSSLQTPRSHPLANTLYFDNRTYINKSEQELPSAIVSKHGQSLILDVEQEPLVVPVAVKLQSGDMAYSDDHRVEYDNEITNIIDGEKGTYWSRTVYLKERVEKVTTTLQFDLGFAKDINYVVIEGGSSEPFSIESIIGVKPSGYRVELNSDEAFIDGKTRINFNKTNLSSVVLTFSVKTFTKAEYFTSNDNKSLNTISSKNMNLYSTLDRNDNISNVTSKAVISDDLIRICNIPTIASKQLNLFMYDLCLDNIWFGNSIYKDAGIFVTKPLSLKNIGVLGVYTDEESESSIVKNSIEYEIIKIDTTPKYKETKFSIPTLNQNIVSSERLVLSKNFSSNIVNDVGILRFLPFIPANYTFSDEDSITIYENDSLLNLARGEWEYAVANSFIDDSTQLDWKTSFLNFDLESYSTYITPIKIYVKITNPKLNAIYTVNYTIQTSDNINIDATSKTVWLDKDRTVYLGDNGRVYFVKDIKTDVSSDIYLQTTLRRNTSTQSKTPILNEYTLLAASYII